MSPPDPVLPWPRTGPWLVIPTAADVDWSPAVAALAGAARARVAAVVLHGGPDPGPAPDAVATWLTVDEYAPSDLDELVDALNRTHGLTLVVAAGEATVPAPPDPVVLVTRPGTAMLGDTTRAATEVRQAGRPLAVILVDDESGGEPLLADVRAALPGVPTGHVTPAGSRLDPDLRGLPAVPARRPRSDGVRILAGLAAFFVVLVLVVVVLAMIGAEA